MSNENATPLTHPVRAEGEPEDLGRTSEGEPVVVLLVSTPFPLTLQGVTTTGFVRRWLHPSRLEEAQADVGSKDGKLLERFTSTQLALLPVKHRLAAQNALDVHAKNTAH